MRQLVAAVETDLLLHSHYIYHLGLNCYSVAYAVTKKKDKRKVLN